MSAAMSERIRTEREAARVSQAQLATAIGVTKQVMSQIETGKVTVTTKRAGAIAFALGITVGRLYGEVPALAGRIHQQAA